MHAFVSMQDLCVCVYVYLCRTYLCASKCIYATPISLRFSIVYGLFLFPSPPEVLMFEIVKYLSD